MGKKWETLTESQQKLALIDIAGTYQQNRLAALMNNYQMAVDATTTSINSQGSAMREQELFNQSLQGRINQLNTAWVDLSNTVGQTVLYDGIVVITSALESLADGGNGVISTIGLLPPIIVGATVAVYGLSSSFRGLVASTYAKVVADSAVTASTITSTNAQRLATASTYSSIMAQRAFTTSTTTTTLAQRVATASTNVYSGALVGLRTAATLAGVALKGLLIATGIGIAFAGVGFIIEKLTKITSDNIQKQEEFESYLKKNSSALTENGEAVEELVSKYNELSSAKEDGSAWDTTKEEEYLSIQQRLGEIFPALIAYTDASGQAHLKNSEEIQKEIEATNELIASQNKVTLSTATEEFEKMNEAVNGAWYDSLNNYIYGSLESRIKQQKQIIESMQNQGLDTSVQQHELLLLEQQVANTTDEIKGKMLEVANAVDEVRIEPTIAKEMESFLRSLDVSNLNPEEWTDFSIKFGKLQTQLQEAIANDDKDLYKNTVDSINELAKTTNDADFKQFTNSYDDMTKSIANSKNQVAGAGDNIDDLGESAGEISPKVDYATASIEEMTEALVQLSQAGREEQAVELLSTDIYNRLADEISPLNKLLEDMAEGKSLSAHEAMELIAKEKDLADAISIENGQVKINKEAVEALRNSKVASYNDMLKSVETEAIATANATISKLKNYGIEIQAIQNLQDAKRRLAELETKKQEMPTGMGGWDVIKEVDTAYASIKDVTDLLANIDQLSQLANSGLKSVGTSTEKASSSTKKSTSATDKDTKAKEANNKATEESIYLTDKYKRALEVLDLAITKQQAIQDETPTWDAKHISALEEQLRLENEKLALHQNQSKEIEKQIKNGAIQQTGIVKQTEAVKTLVKKLSGFNGTITSKFGERADNHRGVDIASKKGTGIDAFAGGTVISAGYAGKDGAEKMHSSYGNVVVVKTDDGTQRIYAHMEKVLVKVGDQIEQGARIGTVGSTGNSTGAHLHYEKSVNGKLVNPYDEVMQARNGITISTSAVVADVQQAIDEAKSSLLAIEQSIIDQQNKIGETEKKLISAGSSVFERARNVADDNYSLNESKLANLNVTSDEYNQLLLDQSNILKDKQTANQQEIDYINQIIANNKLSATTLVELQDRMKQLSTENNNLNQELQGSNLRKYDVFEELRETPEKKIEALRASMDLLDDSSVEYADTLDNIILLLNEIQDVNKKEMLTLADDINSGEYTGEKLEELRDKYEALRVTIKDTNAEIKNTFNEASQIKFAEDDKSIETVSKKLESLNFQLGLIDDEDIDLKVKVYAELQSGIKEEMIEVEKAIASTIAEREVAISKGYSTTVYDDRIDQLIAKRRSQTNELQSIYNQIQSYVKSAEQAVEQAISSGKSLVESSESKAYSDASKAMSDAIKMSEDRIATFSDTLKRLSNQLGLLQESQFDAKIGVTQQQILEARQKASQIIAEYDRVASIPVYNEEQKSQVESTLKSLKDELMSTNLEIVEYVKALETTHFDSLIYGAKEATKEIDRLTGRLNKNLELLEGGLLTGTNLNLANQTFSGKALDLSTLISDPLAEKKAQIQIQSIRNSAYGQQILEAEAQAEREIAIAQDKYNKLLAEAEKFEKAMVEQQLKFEESIKKILEASTKDKENLKKNEGDKLSKTQADIAKSELDTLKRHYDNVKSTLASIGYDIKEQYSSIWGDILRELESNITQAESALSKLNSKVNTTASNTTTVSTGKKINSYAVGTQGAKAGLSLVGEEGKELVVEPDGSAYLTGNMELRNLKAGSQVYTAEETRAMLSNTKTPVPAYAEGTSRVLDPEGDKQKATKIVSEFINEVLTGERQLNDETKGFFNLLLNQLSANISGYFYDAYGNQVNGTVEFADAVENYKKGKEESKENLPPPTSKEDKLVYQYGVPIGWYSPEVAKSIYISDPFQFSIGSDNTEGLYVEPPKLDNGNNNSNNNGSGSNSNGGNSSSGGSTGNSGGSISSGTSKPVTYSDDFANKYEIFSTNPEGNKYQRGRKVKEDEISSLQSILDDLESNPIENEAKIQQLTDEILKKQENLNLEDGLFIIESLTDLAQQRAKIAKETRDKLAEELQKGIDDESLTEETIAKYKDEIYNQDNIISDAQLEQKNLYKQKFDLSQVNRDKALQPFAEAIDDLEHELNMLDEDNLSDRLKLTNEISKQYKNQLTTLKSQKAELENLLSTQKVGSYEWNLTNEAIKDINEQIEDTTEALKGTNEQLKQNANNVVDILKKALEKQRDLIVASLKKQLDDLEKVYKDKMDAIGDRETERTYNNELSDREKEIAEIEKELSKLALDNSQSGIAKRLDLEEQLLEKQEELEEFKYQRSVELEKKAIEDTHEKHKESINTQIKDEEYKFNEMLNDERYWASVREDIVNGNLENVNNKLTGFLDLFKGYNEGVTKELGESFQGLLNLIDELQNSYDSLKPPEVNEIPSEDENKPNDSTVNDNNNSNENDIVDSGNGRNVITLKEFLKLSTSEKKKLFKDDNAYILAKDKEVKVSDALTLTEEELINKYGFKDGGISTSTGLHWLDGTLAKPEIVLNANDTQNLLKSIELNKDFLSNLPKINLPTLPQFNKAEMNSASNYNLTLNIDNLNGTQKDADNLASTIMTNLKRWGR